jgi:hypothetical protein
MSSNDPPADRSNPEQMNDSQPDTLANWPLVVQALNASLVLRPDSPSNSGTPGPGLAGKEP